jgi:hypothetical protein
LKVPSRATVRKVSLMGDMLMFVTLQEMRWRRANGRANTNDSKSANDASKFHVRQGPAQANEATHPHFSHTRTQPTYIFSWPRNTRMMRLSCKLW